MELCSKYGFDPERSVILSKIDPNITFEVVKRAFARLDNVVNIQHLEEQPNGLLCQFEETITPLLLEKTHPQSDNGPCWEVTRIEEYSVCSAPEASPKNPNNQTLVSVIEDITAEFREQIEELAVLYKVNPKTLSQQALSRLAPVGAAAFAQTETPQRQPATSTPFSRALPLKLNSQREFEPTESCQASIEHTSVLDIPAEVQRVIVEHVVKRDSDPVAHVKLRPRIFSGNQPKPSAEVDFTVWRLHVKQALKDSSLSDLHKRRVVLDNLLPPALNVALYIGDNAAPEAYLHELENAYGSVASGEELYIQFLETHQNQGEQASDYLRRLHAALQEVRVRGGLVGQDADAQLLRQFTRGCWDEVLLSRLHLKETLSHPSTKAVAFSELLLKVRVFEQEYRMKEARKKRHFGGSATKVHSNVLVTMPDTPEQEHNHSLFTSMSINDSQSALENRMKKLEAEVAHAKSVQIPQKPSRPARNVEAAESQHRRGNFSDRRRRASQFCYKCGKESHLLSNCTNPVNAALVQQKLCQRHENRKQQHEASQSQALPLND